MPLVIVADTSTACGRMATCDATEMAVLDAHASFEALSTERTAAWFTERLGLQPTVAREVGEPRGTLGRGRPSESAIWSLKRDGAGIEPLDDALLRLLTEFDGREEQLDALRPWFELRVRCYASSDSGQGGFWVSAEVMRRFGLLNVEFHCTVYLNDDDEPETPAPNARGTLGAQWGQLEPPRPTGANSD